MELTPNLKHLQNKRELTPVEELALTDDLEARLASLNMDDLSALDDSVMQEEREAAESSLYDFLRLSWRHFDPSPFNGNWHLGAICEHLEAVARREIRCLVINIPPRCSKSSICNVAFPAWLWCRKRTPGTWFGSSTSFIFTSYAQALTLYHATMCRHLITDRWYQGMWGHRVAIRRDQAQKSEYALEGGGIRLSLSVGSQITGRGYDILVIDDPHNASEAQSDSIRRGVIEWYNQAVSTRANDPNTSCQVLIMQRLHEEDLAGAFLDMEDHVDAHLCIPMEYERDHPYKTYGALDWRDPRKRDGELLWPSRINEGSLRKIKRPLGAYGVAGQLQQRPAPREGGILDPDGIEVVDHLPDTPVVCTVRGWDFAGTDDAVALSAAYTAGVKLVRYRDDPHTYIAHVARFRAGPEQVKERFLATCRTDGVRTLQDIPQDPGAAGLYVVRDLSRAAQGYSVMSTPETGDKVLRAMPMSSDMRAGLFRVLNAEWWQELYDEMKFFPLGKWCDQIDAASRAYNRLCLSLDSGLIGAAVEVTRDGGKKNHRRRVNLMNSDMEALSAEEEDSQALFPVQTVTI